MKQNTLNGAIYLSAILLIVGVFLPLASLPIYGNITYNRIAEIESYLVILFTLSAPILLFLGKPKSVILSPISVWAVLLFPALKNIFNAEEERGFFAELGDKAASVMQDFAAELFLNITDFNWGGYVFLLGLIVFTISCLIRCIKK
ncbi:MAG: hypothetical protein HKN08_11110 [Gammaproteobacteria bacterium]|nr:hypothetical protein [Gammaproteobacteria bacterium]